MPITAADIKAQILLETGDVDPLTTDTPVPPVVGVVALGIDALWAKYAGKDQIAPRLRELFVKRDALKMILAVLAQKRFDVADVLAGLTVKANQIWTHYWDMLGCVKDEIAGIEKTYGASSVYIGERLRTRAPYTPPFPPDGNAPHYGGSPYSRRRVNRGMY